MEHDTIRILVPQTLSRVHKNNYKTQNTARVERSFYKQAGIFVFPKTTKSCPYDRGPHHRHTAHAIGLLDLERLDRPIFLRVVQDGPIRAELAHPGTGGDTLLQPSALIQVRLVDQLESVNVGLEVVRKEVVIVVTNGVQQSK